MIQAIIYEPPPYRELSSSASSLAATIAAFLPAVFCEEEFGARGLATGFRQTNTGTLGLLDPEPQDVNRPFNCEVLSSCHSFLQWHDGSDHSVGAGRGCGDGVIAGAERIDNWNWLRPAIVDGST